MAKNRDNKKPGKKRSGNQGGPSKADVENRNPRNSEQSVLMDDV